MAKEIKQKITLEGEKEYSAAIREANRNLKTLRSELKAETAELGANATAQQKSEVRIKSLQKQIKEQEKVVKTCQAALAEAKKEYGDNEEVVAKWEQKLNDARTALANMKNSLESTSQAVQKTGSSFREAADGAAATVTATKSVADALGEIGSVGDSVADAIENIFTGCIGALETAVSELWAMVSESAAKANNWTDIAGYWGTDAQTIQQYARAVQASANSFEDLQSAVSKIVLGGKGKDITELIGISKVNYKDDWAYAMAVMDQLHRMQQEGQNMTPIWEGIFGEKRSTKVMDLLNDWDEITKNLAMFNGNETGYGMNDKMLSTMNDLWVDINRIGEKWDAIKDRVAGGLGETALTLLVNVEGSLDAIADFLNADEPGEREEALKKLRANVEEFFTKLADILREGIRILGEVGEELQKSDDPLTALVGDILVKLTGALQWMVDNQDAVKGAFEAIFGFWLLAKLAAVAGKLAGIITQIETIKAFNALELGGAAGAAAAGSAANTASAGGSSILRAISMGIKAAAPYAGFGAVVSGAATLVDASGTRATQELLEELNSLSKNRDGADAVTRALKALGAAYEDVVAGNGDIKSALREIDPEVLRQVIPGSDMFKQLDQWYGGDWGKFLEDQPGTALLDWVEEFARTAVEKAKEEPAGAPKQEAVEKAKEEPAETPKQEAAEEAKEAAEAVQEAAAAIQEAADAVQEAEENAKKEGGSTALPWAAFSDGTLIDEMMAALEDERGRQGQEQLDAAKALLDQGSGTIGDLMQRLAKEYLDAFAYKNSNPAMETLYNSLSSETRDRFDSLIEDVLDHVNLDPYDTLSLLEKMRRELDAAGRKDEQSGPTEMQQAAAESYWDIFRKSFDGAPDEWDRLLDAFKGNEALVDKLTELIDTLEEQENWRDTEDLPAHWWLDAENWRNSGNNSNGLTSADMQTFRSLPAAMAASVQQGAAAGVSGIKVTLDGYTVGMLVAKYVGQSMARDIII